MTLRRLFGQFQDQVHGILRIVAGYAFMLHGAQKLLGILGADGPVEYVSRMGLAGLIELGAGALIMVGLFTGLAAFIASGEMAVAYLMAHVGAAGGLLTPITNRGEPAVLYCFIFLFIATAGSGAFSLDRVLSRGKAS